MKKRGFFGVSWVEFSDPFEKKKNLRTGRRDWPTALQIDYVKTLERREIKREQYEEVGKPKRQKVLNLRGTNTKQILGIHNRKKPVSQLTHSSLVPLSLITSGKLFDTPVPKNCSTTFTILNYHFYFIFFFFFYLGM